MLRAMSERLFTSTDPSQPAVGLLRDARVEDAAEIEAVHYAAREAIYRGKVAQWPPVGLSREARVERWADWLADTSIHCIVAERSGEIIGFSTVRPTPDEDEAPDRVAEMPTLYVRPDSWRSGLGRLLCSAALTRVAQLGFEELTLWVLEMNTRARAFYEAVGFAPDGAIKIDTGTPEGLVAHRYRIAINASGDGHS